VSISQSTPYVVLSSCLFVAIVKGSDEPPPGFLLLQPRRVSMESTDISFRVINDTLYICVCGAFGYATSLNLKRLLSKNEMFQCSNVEFDLAQVSTIDSSGLGLIKAIARDVKKRRGRLSIVKAQPHVHQVLELVNTFGLLPIHPLQGEALRGA